jgi:hypothetical protein
MSCRATRVLVHFRSILTCYIISRSGSEISMIVFILGFLLQMMVIRTVHHPASRQVSENRGFPVAIQIPPVTVVPTHDILEPGSWGYLEDKSGYNPHHLAILRLQRPCRIHSTSPLAYSTPPHMLVPINGIPLRGFGQCGAASTSLPHFKSQESNYDIRPLSGDPKTKIKACQTPPPCRNCGNMLIFVWREKERFRHRRVAARTERKRAPKLRFQAMCQKQRF